MTSDYPLTKSSATITKESIETKSEERFENLVSTEASVAHATATGTCVMSSIIWGYGEVCDDAGNMTTD
jgi:hypothetical protein